MLDASNIFRVDGIVAVVTGGGTGLGLIMAKALVANGAKKVYILGRRQEALQEAASFSPTLVPLQCDVTSKDSLQAAVDHIAGDTGHVNLLVANSGVNGPPKPYDATLSIAELRERLFTSTNMEEFTTAFHVNVTGAFFTMAAFLELLNAGNVHALRGGYGAPLSSGGNHPSIQSQVVFTASVSSFMRGHFSPPAYAGSKSAILHLAKQAASQLAPYGIRVNVIAPGLFPSEMAARLIASRKPEEETPDDSRFIPARRFGTEEELAGSILSLASRAGAYTNGQITLPDGGRLAVALNDY